MSKSNAQLQANDTMWVGLYDANNPKSVYSRVPKKFKWGMDQIPENIRHLDEEDLLKKCDPSASVCESRVKFWHQFQNEDRPLRIADIFYSRQTFESLIKCP